MGAAAQVDSVGAKTARAEDAPERRRVRRPWFLPEGRLLSGELWQQRHRGLTILLWIHVPALFVYGVFRDATPQDAALQVAILVVPATIALVPMLGRNVQSASTSLGLVIAASILVHMSGGSIEAHFQFFVVIAFLTLYQAWLPFLLALAYVIGEHGVLGAIDPRAVYNNPSDIAHPWKFALIHGGFVLAASVANVLSWRLTEQEALHDGLTGLPNRAFLLDSLTKLLGSRGRRNSAVLYVDLDNFKNANDAFGHQVGDELLIALARRLEGQLRAGDVIARLGGDEFAILLTDTEDRAQVHATAKRLLTAFGSPVRINDLTIVAGASIGVAFTEDADTAENVLRDADLAMYEAKRDGGGRVAEYRPQLHSAAVRRAELEVELRAALSEDQFVLHYQPIVDLRTERIVGTEALVRWQHPVHGLLGPDEFITAAEMSGLIVPLGGWVVREACRQTAAWALLTPDRAPLSVAVNLSPVQLLDRTLVGTVAEALHDSGLEPSRLCLEITEGSVIKDFDAIMPTLCALRTLGVSLALDDFGTGYSSLSYLKELPVNSVKIDRSFVHDLDASTHNGKIVLAIIELAHALGMSVTAEGAETNGQLDTLKAMRSDHAQGYLLGRPVEHWHIERRLDEQRPQSCSTTAGLPTQRNPGRESVVSPGGNR
ncbi:MAG: EAL domain-containing protein [Frankiaceae bacterium]|nr:EAL domain-containing protein [Frankiaceae bacterium]MBV9871118.1 EAL domain-containing protein [Frankiaceae bacterium]